VNIAEICPCVNLECPNHGNCARCISRHTRLGSLNYCSFYASLPALEEAIKADPTSPTSAALRQSIDRRLEVNAGLMKKHGLSEAKQAALRKKVAEYSDY